MKKGNGVTRTIEDWQELTKRHPIRPAVAHDKWADQIPLKRTFY